MVDWRRVAVGAGVAAAGVAAGYAGERLLLRGPARAWERDAEPPPIRGELSEVIGPDGVRLVVESHGDPRSPEIVLVHGFCLTARSWREQVAALQDRFRLVTYDQPGHGRSGPPQSGDYSLELLADCLAAVVEERTGGRIVLVGHSMGGMAALALARHHPGTFKERVGGLVLVSTAAKLGGTNLAVTTALRTLARGRALLERAPRIGPRVARLSRPSDLTFAVARAVGFTTVEDPQVVRFAEEEVLATPLETITGLASVVLAVDEEATLAAIDVPTVVVIGADDRMTPITHSRRMAEVNPRVQLVELADVGHLAQMTSGPAVNGEIARVAAEVRPFDEDEEG